jgi:outer membrane usher protein
VGAERATHASQPFDSIRARGFAGCHWPVCQPGAGLLCVDRRQCIIGRGRGRTGEPGQAAPARTTAGDAREYAPAVVQFNSSLLAGSVRQTDISAFSHGNPMVAGVQRVDIYINGNWQGRRDIEFKAGTDGRVDACQSLAVLEELGIDTSSVQEAQGDATTAAPSDACVPVQQRIPHAFGAFDSGTLRYDLSIPQSFLRRDARGYVNAALWDRGINAGFIGYSFSAVNTDSRVDGNRSRNAYLGLNTGINVGGWQLRHDSNLTWNRKQGSEWQSIATYAQRAFPRVRGLLTVGESYTNGELFDSIGFRGVNLSSDDRMLPDSQRGYAPVVRGIAETNARVEIRQRGQLIHSTTVAPGNFVIDDLFPTGYGGDLEVNVLEADGRRREFLVPFGSVAQMLRPGVSRYSMTVGQARSALLQDDPWLLQGTYQRGVGNQLTLYGGTSLSEGYLSLLYGAGVSTKIGAFAADVTHARTRLHHAGARQGASMRLSYSHLIGASNTNLTLAAYRYSTEGFYGLQDAMYARDALKYRANPDVLARQRSQFQLTLNQPLGPRRGSLYLTGSVRDFYGREGSSTQYQAGYNNAWRRVNFGFSALRTRDGMAARSDTQYLLSVSVPLGGGVRPLSVSADVGMRAGQGYENSRLGITGSAGVDNNLTFGVALSDRRQGGTSGMANAEYRSRYAAFNGSYSQSGDFRQASLGATGSMVMHAGGITLAPQRGDTMVLVQADGARDARVGNLPGLRIDGRGYAVVPYVSPYRMNSIALDPQGMALDVELESSSQTVAPYSGAISYLRFGTRKGKALLIQVRNTEHLRLPFGAQVKDAQGQPVGMVSQGGRVYVRSNDDQGRLMVEWGAGAGQRCTIDYQVPTAADTSRSGYIPLQAECR